MSKAFQFPGLNSFVSTFDLANLFNVFQDPTLPQQTDASYNICRTFMIKNLNKIPPTFYEVYTPRESDCWTLISYNYYGTIELWWLILKMNGIADATKEPYEFESLKLLKANKIKNILSAIRNG